MFTIVLRGLIAICAAGVLWPNLAWAQCVKTVRWYDDAPYYYKAADGEVVGLNADLVRAALKGLQCEAQFVELPWARALRELELGRLDILPGAFRTPEREKYAYFSRPVNRSPNVLFIAKRVASRYKPKTLADISGTGFRMGAQIGVAYGPDYDALIKTPAFAAQITPVTSRRNAWKMIEQDRLDGIIADEISGLVELQQMGLSEAVVKTEVIVSGEAVQMALSQASLTPEFVADFDRSLNTMMADGRYKKILERYVPCTVQVSKLGCR
jgi:polar amino acid transport system substrate-binding protein